MTQLLDEPLRKAALARFGLLDGARDYNIERVVRLAAMSTGCLFATFSLQIDGQGTCVADFAEDEEMLPQLRSFIQQYGHQPEPCYMRDLAYDARWADHAAVVGEPRLRAGAVVPVYGASPQVIGNLAVLSASVKDFDTAVMRRVLNDCVRLIEDSLIMRNALLREPCGN